MTDEPAPIMIVLGANDPSPFMTIEVRCSRCRAVVSSCQIDARRDTPSDGGQRAGEAARAFLAHRCQEVT